MRNTARWAVGTTLVAGLVATAGCATLSRAPGTTNNTGAAPSPVNSASSTSGTGITSAHSVDIAAWTTPAGYNLKATLSVGGKVTTNDGITCGNWAGSPPAGAYYIPVELTISDGGGNSGPVPIGPYVTVIAAGPSVLASKQWSEASVLFMSEQLGEFNSGCRENGWPVQVPRGGSVTVAGALRVDPKRSPLNAAEIGLLYTEDGKQQASYKGVPVQP